MKLCIFGAGGIGGYLGARLADAGHEVHLIARGEHLAALQSDGLRVESIHGDAEGDLPATDDPAEVGPCDAVLLCVKSYDTGAAAADLGPLVGEDTAVISFQNGPDNEDLLVERIGRGHVMGGVSNVLSTNGGPGVIEHTGGPAEFVFGELDGRRSERAERFLEYCERATGVNPTLSTAIDVDVWRKVAFICAQSGTTAAVRLPLGEIRSAPESWATYRRIVEEACAVARAEGVDLPDGTVDELIEFAEGLGEDAYSSLHYDMTHGKRMELDALHGTVVDLAAEHALDVPACEAVYAILEPWAERNASNA
jgi:2-dehydropantoate 2-reductase